MAAAGVDGHNINRDAIQLSTQNRVSLSVTSVSSEDCLLYLNRYPYIHSTQSHLRANVFVSRSKLCMSLRDIIIIAAL